MLTIFSCPKPFRGHIGTIQRNAIQSWTLLRPRPEVILIGDDEGTAEVCKEFGIRHIPDVEQSEYGTPLVSSIFQKAQEAASHDVMCYVNADIILMSDFMKAIELVTRQNGSFLLSGRRWDVEINERLSFDKGWEKDLKDLAKRNGKLHSYGGIDYFVFPKWFFREILPFAIGRFAWDWWLIWYARSRKATVIDSTNQNVIIHQDHTYMVNGILCWSSGIPKSTVINQNNDPIQIIDKGDIERNKMLAKNRWWPYYAHNLLDCTHVLGEKGVERVPFVKRLDPWILKLKICVYRDLERYFPYSYPLYFLGKSIVIFVGIIIGLMRKILYIG